MNRKQRRCEEYLAVCKVQREQEIAWRAERIANKLSWACKWDRDGNISAVRRSG